MPDTPKKFPWMALPLALAVSGLQILAFWISTLIKDSPFEYIHLSGYMSLGLVLLMIIPQARSVAAATFSISIATYLIYLHPEADTVTGMGVLLSDASLLGVCAVILVSVYTAKKNLVSPSGLYVTLSNLSAMVLVLFLVTTKQGLVAAPAGFSLMAFSAVLTFLFKGKNKVKAEKETMA